MKTSEQGRAVLIEGKPYARKADGSLVPIAGKTDFTRLDAMSNEEIEAGAKAPDAVAMTDQEWAFMEIRRPNKVPLSLKLDDDVLVWYRALGKGYQTKINAILRNYMEVHRKAG
jgi:uncharacterized protein (DUF4415 family)